MHPDPEVTRAQQNFLAAFTQNPHGPAPADWPSPGVLRRWLKDRRFKKALSSIRDAIRFQTDFHLASAASTAARAVQTTINPATTAAATDPEALADLSKSLRSLTDLLRLAHVRERFTTPPRPHAPRRDSVEEHNRKVFASAPAPAHGGWEGIFKDPERLKGIMLLAVMQGATIYDPFLVSFPEELAEARASRERHLKATAAAQPTPDPSRPS